MSSKGNTNHVRLLNKLKMCEEFKNDRLCISVETWGFSSKYAETKVELWSDQYSQTLFKGTTMTGLERFINEEREKVGLFKPRGAQHKKSIEEVILNEG